ncbi:MAG TPA: ADP-ribosylglycohydrolase family protein, partial [Nocardioides sp.]|nr:ADP-ribosylglycohydrolase family protein [Nocardioides sp.]
MSRLTWVQLPDLLAHELVASAHDGKDVADVRDRWEQAGGQVDAPASGRGQAGDDRLRALAAELLDELDSRPADPALLAREPYDLAAIEATWTTSGGATDPGTGLDDRLLGAWLGRAAGCLLGKPVEKIPREGIREILVSQGRWPLDDWFTAKDLPDDVGARWPWNRRSAGTSLAENIQGMPEDDDLNFPMLALDLLERHGDALTTDDVADSWLANLPGGRVFTAERVAYRNLLLGEVAPRTAILRNPFREWIGAQIRTDVYGWARPGRPAEAARLAWRDARLSHVRNGVYGAMFVAAACARAVVSKDIGTVLEAGLSVVPPESRYAEAVRYGAELGRSAAGTEEGLDALHARYGDLHWVHVLNNAALVGFALTA